MTQNLEETGEEYQIVLLDYRKEKGENVDHWRSVANSLNFGSLRTSQHCL